MTQARWYSRHYAWIGLIALWVIGFIGTISRFIMTSYQVQMAEDLQVGRGFISAAWSTNLFIAALCAPIGGRLVDRYGPKRIMFISSLFGIAGTALVFPGHHPAFFFAGYGILSGLTGLGASTAYVLVFKWFGRHKAKAAGLLSSASSVGLAVCTPLFVTNSQLTWEYAFLISALLGLAITLPLIMFVIRPAEMDVDIEDAAEQSRPVEEPAPAVKETAGKLVRLPFLIIAFAIFTCGINMGTVEMNLVAIHQQAEVSAGMIALSMGVLGVMEIAGSLVFGFTMDAINKRLAMALLYGIRVISFLILLWHPSWSPVAFAVTFGLTYLSAVPGGMVIANELTSRKGTLIGNLMLFHQAGGILGALVGGIAYDMFNSYQILIGIDAVLCVIAAAGYMILKLHPFGQGKRELYQAG
ncbi:MFS transporter [Paenibacillus sp. OAS669]|uniref:MFS transporter n=1 Tax=Paenibacillus sp. OAS669 TaxID=2663821 RepID=UPI001789517A|nr:MFS transporter [Paenibacillus sp. OAS669]MBE1440790.1 MFS family permease [Paenibacillus sp. OAS669]